MVTGSAYNRPRTFGSDSPVQLLHQFVSSGWALLTVYLSLPAVHPVSHVRCKLAGERGHKFSRSYLQPTG